MRLSPNFELAEFVTSREGGARGIDNTPPPALLDNLRKVALALEQIRAVALNGAPIVITSGYRCSRLNSLVGGSPSSAHLEGLAADFIAPQFGTPADVCHAIVRHDLAFDQLIHEYDWVHFALGPRMRGQILTYQGNGKYLPGILEKA
jgi:zinc D-Ala-D-Ala carboxypeptidase